MSLIGGTRKAFDFLRPFSAWRSFPSLQSLNAQALLLPLRLLNDLDRHSPNQPEMSDTTSDKIDFLVKC